ncbi:MAG TPA: DUF4239 domain-containing protein [Verrucomicrobiae bacterium]|jgi:hypothetical protein|nr:DUF4239 domain-containing protein [Verrucomicrobiae bacterium]
MYRDVGLLFAGNLSGSFLGGALFVGLGLVLSLGAAAIVRRFANNALLREHNDIAGFILAVVGVVYAVLLAFVAVGAWERFALAEVHTYDEANALTQTYRDVGIFPEKTSVRRELRFYVNDVVNREWPAMATGGQSRDAAATIELVAQQIRNMHPNTPGPQNVQAELLTGIDKALLDRANRLSMDADGLNNIVWTTLAAGAIVTVGFTLLFGFKSRALQMLMTGGLTFSIVIVFYLAASLDYPFQGHIHVLPHAFVSALHSFDIVDRVDTPRSY